MATRLTSAGRIIGAGLVCFGAWFLLDARELHTSAVSAPIGTRRSVSLDITGPVARVEEALSLDRIVDAANRALGKTGSPGGSATAASPPPPPVSAPPAGSGTGSATGRHGGSGHTSTGARRTAPPAGAVPTTTTTTTPSRLAALPAPSAAHPLTLLDVGDSIGEDLGIGLADVLGAAPHVTVLQKAVGDTGLADQGYYDWLAQLPIEVAQYRPQVVVVMLGGNDVQSFQDGNVIVPFGGALWRRVYSQRVGEMMSAATRDGAKVAWVGMPIMGPTSGLSNTDIEMENAVYASEARLHPGVLYISSWRLFEDAAGNYATYLTSPSGNLVQVRDADEVHIDPPGGTDLLASYVVEQMDRAWHVHI